MCKTKFLSTVLFFAFLTAGCQNANQTPLDTIPVTEMVQQAETMSAPDIPETEETQPGVESYQAYRWMTNLKAEDVAFVEFINLNEDQFSYRRYEGEEIQEVIDIFQAKKCLEYMPFHPVHEYTPILQWPGYYSNEFHIVMKDGTAHTVCSVYSTVTVIDGTAFHTISDWLNHHWPEVGNAPLPETWVQEAATRDYQTAEDFVSTHSTSVHDSQRSQLDESYNTDVEFGSVSRNYPIGRGGLAELAASGVTRDGLSLSTMWTGTGGITQLHLQPQYWLEKWQEDVGCYLPIDGSQFQSESPREFLTENTCFWHLSWKDTCGFLEPGHYRVGMTFYEEYNGHIQNETICYAKFSITEGTQ